MGSDYSLDDVTVGIKTFYRTEKLAKTLASIVNLDVKKVIVADDGEIDEEKERLYEKMSEMLPLEVLRLPYDSGLSYGRNRIVEKTKTKYLLIIDDDMEINEGIILLKTILENDDSLGGVSAILSEYGVIKAGTQNLMKEGEYLIIYVPNSVKVYYTSFGIPYMIFDFIPNATLFRRDALRDYSWDEHYKIGFEHLDFFWGHKRLGKWKFAVTPSVIFKHYPGGSYKYLSYRNSKKRLLESRQYFLKKWKFKKIITLSSGLFRLVDFTSITDFAVFWAKKQLYKLIFRIRL